MNKTPEQLIEEVNKRIYVPTEYEVYLDKKIEDCENEHDWYAYVDKDKAYQEKMK